MVTCNLHLYITIECIYLRNDMDGYEFLLRVAHVPPNLWIDIDEMSVNPKDMLEHFGYSKVGEECYKTQIIIGTRSFSIIAAIMQAGFLCWSIFEGNHTNIINIYILYL